ncbi:MAG: hypothetical protein ACJAZ3_002068 [Sphingobacteriales bacterium]|jgi:hypothetical protein
MKKINSTIFISLVSILVFSQAKTNFSYYTFEVEKKPYQYLQNDTIYIDEELEFSHNTNGGSIETFAPKSFYKLDNPITEIQRYGSIEIDYNENADIDTILVLDAFTMTIFGQTYFRFFNHKPSYISYLISNTTMGRKLSIQYFNLTYFDSLPNDSINFQVNVYENGTIEYHYGPTYIEDVSRITSESYNAPDIAFGVREINADYVDLYILHGDPSNPIVTRKNNFLPGLDSIPENGQVYRFRFNGKSLGIFDKLFESIPLNYSINSSFIRISDERIAGSEYRVVNLSGQLLDNGVVYGKQLELDITDFEKSIHFIQFHNDKGFEQTLKFLVP